MLCQNSNLDSYDILYSWNVVSFTVVYHGIHILKCCTVLFFVLKHLFISSFTLMMHWLQLKMLIDISIIRAFFYKLSSNHLPTAPKSMIKIARFDVRGRGWGCSHSSAASPILKPWQIFSWKSNTSLPLEFSKYLVIFSRWLEQSQYDIYIYIWYIWYRIICTTGLCVQDRPEAVGYISFILTLDSSGVSGDISHCSMNKFLLVLFLENMVSKLFMARANSLCCWFQPCCHPQTFKDCYITWKARITEKIAHSNNCQIQNQPLSLISIQSTFYCLHCIFLLLHCWGIIVFVFVLMMWLCVAFALFMWAEGANDIPLGLYKKASKSQTNVATSLWIIQERSVEKWKRPSILLQPVEITGFYACRIWSVELWTVVRFRFFLHFFKN